MPGILNYTTMISPVQTANEIHALLAQKGAASVTTLYERGQVSGVAFVMDVGGVPVNFRLPVNVAGVAEYMKRRTKLTPAKIAEQAPRTAWRILKDWTAVQIALVESRQAEMAQVFMPYALSDGGASVYDLFREGTQRKLGTGK